MPLITTTHGPVEDSTLLRTVGFEDRPGEFVVWVEWRLIADSTFTIRKEREIEWVEDDPLKEDPFGERFYEVTTSGKANELVRRDAHVILKQPSAVADAIAGGL